MVVITCATVGMGMVMAMMMVMFVVGVVVVRMMCVVVNVGCEKRVYVIDGLVESCCHILMKTTDVFVLERIGKTTVVLVTDSKGNVKRGGRLET